jgi:hypothetical protein
MQEGGTKKSDVYLSL